MTDTHPDDHKITRDLDWNINDLSSLKNKVVIVTGANSLASIGGNIAHQLALRGAKVYIGARNLSKAKAGIKDILALSPSLEPSNLRPFVAAIDDYAAVKAAAERFQQEESRLDILVNNAGIFPLSSEFDQFGINKVMATNHLGPFLLTKMLLPLLEKTAKENATNDVRIVNVSSTAIFTVPEGHSLAALSAWNDSFGGDSNPLQFLHRYSYSKIANVLFTRELKRRFDEKLIPVMVTAVHPGVVATPGSEKVLGADDEDYKKAITAYEGALTAVWAAAHPEVRASERDYDGMFLVPYGALGKVPDLAANMAEAEALWSISENLLTDVVRV